MNTLSEKPAMLNIALAVLMILMLALNCVGYYPTESGNYSIMGYVAMPSDYPELESFFEEHVEDFNVNDVVGTPLWVFLIGAVACVVCIVFRDHAAASLAGAWALAHPQVSCVLTGARTAQQALQNAAAADIAVSPAELKFLEEGK